ncbi:hypothetical protein [Allochromatium palmeri]|uniref:Uncharacterized protein n=1 Tax=Allochromatium palmeri TaxID=231048 RepID=A0A6N8EHQ7_9GAMM|nr:hypothetical protein [Allochromatium palmeri]MTW22246.1 hypothetical protein [Allochromatium palmeri]
MSQRNDRGQPVAGRGIRHLLAQGIQHGPLEQAEATFAPIQLDEPWFLPKFELIVKYRV